MVSSWILLIFAATLNAIANLLIKRSTMQGLQGVEQLLSPFFIFGVLLFAANIIFYAKALQGLSVNIAYPALVGVGALFVLIGSYVWLKETINLVQIIGFVLIIVGVILISK